MWCRKILAILLFVVPVIYLTSIVTPSHNATSRQSTFQTYTTLQDVQQALNQAKQNNKPVLLDFYAQWCAGCRVMDEKTFTDPKIKDKLKDYIWVKADITDYSFASETLLNYFHIPMPPAVLLFNKNGKEQARLIGEVPSEQLLNAADNQNGLNTND